MGAACWMSRHLSYYELSIVVPNLAMMNSCLCLLIHNLPRQHIGIYQPVISSLHPADHLRKSQVRSGDDGTSLVHAKSHRTLLALSNLPLPPA